MDQSLLQRRDVETDEHQPTSEQASHANNEHAEEQQQFRDLVIEKPMLPLRVNLKQLGFEPVDYDGEKFNEMIFDFDSMTAKDFQRAEREFTHLYKPDRNETVPLIEMKHLFHAIIAKNLANVPLGVIYKLPRRIYVPLRLEVLKACGSSPEEEKA